MTTLLLPLVDHVRGRELPTTLHLPEPAARPLPLIVFGHGYYGHPRKFTTLLGAWAEAGFAVAAPAFPLTNDEAPEVVADDLANQPADVRFVIDELLRRDDVPRVDARRIGVAGFSFGAVTALAVGVNTRHRDPRVRAVAALAGCFWSPYGGSYDIVDVPLLLVHGTLDDKVAYALGEAVYDAARPPKVLVTLENAQHDVAQDSSPRVGDAVAVTTAFWHLTLRDERDAALRLLAPRPDMAVRAEGL